MFGNKSFHFIFWNWGRFQYWSLPLTSLTLYNIRYRTFIGKVRANRKIQVLPFWRRNTDFISHCKSQSCMGGLASLENGTDGTLGDRHLLRLSLPSSSTRAVSPKAALGAQRLHSGWGSARSLGSWSRRTGSWWSWWSRRRESSILTAGLTWMGLT